MPNTTNNQLNVNVPQLQNPISATINHGIELKGNCHQPSIISLSTSKTHNPHTNNIIS